MLPDYLLLTEEKALNTFFCLILDSFVRASGAWTPVAKSKMYEQQVNIFVLLVLT